MGATRTTVLEPPSGGAGVAGALTLGWAMISTAAVVTVLAAPVPPLTIAAGRTGVTCVLWTLIACIAARRSGPPGPSGPLPMGRILFSGALLGVHFAMWIASLTLTSVAHGAVLVALQPLFAGLFGLVLGDRAALGRLFLGVVVAAGGTALMTTSEASAEGATWQGDVLAIAAGACSALYLTVNRGIGAAVPLPRLLAWVNGIAALTILAAVPLFGESLWHVDATFRRDGVWILWLGVGPGLFGHGLMNWAARRIAVHVVSLVVLLEPLGAAVLAWLVLGQGFGGREAVGALLLLAGAAIATWTPKRR